MSTTGVERPFWRMVTGTPAIVTVAVRVIAAAGAAVISSVVVPCWNPLTETHGALADVEKLQCDALAVTAIGAAPPPAPNVKRPRSTVNVHGAASCVIRTERRCLSR